MAIKLSLNIIILLCLSILEICILGLNILEISILSLKILEICILSLNILEITNLLCLDITILLSLKNLLLINNSLNILRCCQCLNNLRLLNDGLYVLRSLGLLHIHILWLLLNLLDRHNLVLLLNWLLNRLILNNWLRVSLNWLSKSLYRLLILLNVYWSLLYHLRSYLNWSLCLKLDLLGLGDKLSLWS